MELFVCSTIIITLSAIVINSAFSLSNVVSVSTTITSYFFVAFAALTNSQYIENSKDAIINLDKKITETKTFRELVPELKEKGIVDVRVRRVDNTRFEFIGINNAGEIVRLESLEQTEGTNPNEDIIKVNEDGSSVEKEKTMTMLKIKPGENEQNSNEGFAM